MNLIVIALIAFDIFIVGFLYFWAKRLVQRRVVQLEDVFEERNIIRNIKEELLSSIESTIKANQQILDRVRSIAAEAEIEISQGKVKLREDLEAVMGEFSEKLSAPLDELSRRQGAMEKLVKQVRNERVFLNKSMERAEILIKFFNKDLPYHEIMREIQDKKYSDAHLLLSRGASTQEIAKELGLSEAEIRVVINSVT